LYALSRSTASRAETPPKVSASSSKVSSATNRQARDACHGLDRRTQLVEVEEGLDHEQIDAATLEQGGLLGEDWPTLIRREAAELSEGPIEPAT